MKYILKLVFFLLFSFHSRSQCYDVFGRISDCPTENDSLLIYNNSLKVYEFYEKNIDYVKLKSKRLRTRQDVIDCFYQMQDAVDSFTNRYILRERVLNGEDIPSILLPRDGKNIPINEYYSYIDTYKFYQRELENGILNISSPFPIYDIRIAPRLINSYENRYSSDEFNGDFVNVALYIPVTVKPYNMLTDSEKIVRKKILEGQINIVQKKVEDKKIVQIPKVNNGIKDTTLLINANIEYNPPIISKELIYTRHPWDAEPVYGYDLPIKDGQLWLIGYWIKGKFRKYLPTDEFYEFMPKSLKEFLNDDKRLEQYLRIRYGSYYQGILK